MCGRYIALEKLDVVPLYFAAERPVVTRNGQLIVVERPEGMRLEPGEKAETAESALPVCRPPAADRGYSKSMPPRSMKWSRRCSPPKVSERAGAAHRSRSGRRHGDEETRGLFLMRVAALREEIATADVAVKPLRPAPQEAGMVRLLTVLGRRRQVDADRVVVGGMPPAPPRISVSRLPRNRVVNGEKIDFSLLLDGFRPSASRA